MKKETLELGCFSIILFIAIAFITYTSYIGYKVDKGVSELRAKQVQGKISNLKNLQRGSYNIQIRNGKNSTKIRSLHIGWYVEKMNIQLNDSVYKKANNDTLVFFKLKDSKWVKNFDYILSLQ